jgi:hypothetical protein
VILSNSCDIDPTNRSTRPRSVLFSPLIKLANYQKLLKKGGKSERDILNITDSIKKQEMTYLFYLPAHSQIIDESIIVLDNIYQHPLNDFHLKQNKKKLFTLTQSAFYLFLIKLSIHFTRFQEGVHRFSEKP